MEVKQEQPLCPIEECVVKTEFIGFPKVSVHSSLKTEIQEDQYVEDSIKNDTKSYFVDGCPSDHLNMDITVEDIKLEEDKAELVQIGDVMEIKHEIKQEVGEYDKESQLFTPIKLEDVKDEPPKGEDCSGFVEGNKMEVIKTSPELAFNKEQYLGQFTEEFLCEICYKQFSLMKDLQKHVKVHNKPYSCHICFKMFSRKGSLRIHMRTHDGKKPYQCEICLKTFSQSWEVENHMPTHTGKKPYQCEICFKSFSRPNNLRNHRKLHTGEKPYQCRTCFKSFIRLDDLKKHIRIHTGEKPYNCEICFKSFTQSNNLNNHMGVHTGEKPYLCEICSKSFTTKTLLKSHTKTHTRPLPSSKGQP
ncbi:uncharacterized protein [Diabrotica undecimpunctata]|uniref:uncharacterized protein isoform X4 n=1 Tax=Diabrotica undecimpunctata TaxID=50387 RepID=UPI003B63EE89